MTATILLPWSRLLWVAFPGVLGGYSKIVDLALRLGFDAIAPRSGLGNPDGTVTPSLKPAEVRLIRDAGLGCAPWDYSRPAAIRAHAEHYRQLEDAGATAIIDDAELPWDQDPNAKDDALRYGELVREKVTVPVFDAPWPAISWHPGYPEAEFRSWVDGRLLQAYWTEIGWSARKTLDLARAQWAGRDDRLYPIGVTYGREEIRKWGGQQLPPREIDLGELRAVAAECSGGWYSAEASAPGALESVAEALRDADLAASGRAGRPMEPGLDLDQGGPAVPFAWVDRAEWDASEDERSGVLAWHGRNRETYETEARG